MRWSSKSLKWRLAPSGLRTWIVGVRKLIARWSSKSLKWRLALSGLRTWIVGVRKLIARWSPKSLKWRLTAGAIAIALAVNLMTYVTLSSTAQRVASAAAAARAGELASFLTMAIAESVAARDRLQIQLLANAFRRNGVYAIEVLDAAGKTLYATAELAESKGPDLTAWRRSPREAGVLGTTHLHGKDYLHAAREVRFADRPVGSIHVLLDKSDLEEGIRNIYVPTHAIVTFGLALLTGIGLLNLYIPFRELKKLCAAARQIGSGDLTARVPVEGGDELAQFCAGFNSMVEGLLRARQEATEKQLETIHAMINTVEAKDQYTAGHCCRVGGYCKEILEERGAMPSEEAFLIQTAALLHDIGKLGIPDKVLLKAGQLTEEELKVIQSHVTVGEGILVHLDSMRHVATWVRHHHERWDGRGYPDGLAGEAIPFASRVIAVADTIDAMLTHRPYRKALPLAKAIHILREGKGTQFDPEVVEWAIACLERKGNEKSSASVRIAPVDLERELQLA